MHKKPEGQVGDPSRALLHAPDQTSHQDTKKHIDSLSLSGFLEHFYVVFTLHEYFIKVIQFLENLS
jgi:hypothetical protein